MKRAQPASEHVSSRRKPTEKKTRFISPEDDPARFAEHVDAQLEDNKKVKRKGGVRTEGYDSDSSDDGEGVVLSRRKNAEKDGGGDEDDDMFAMGGSDKEDAKAAESAAKKKKEEYLRLGDIEGQEFNDGSGGSGGEHDDDDDDLADTDESEPEDEDDAERRKKAGMGFELSKFNMRDEMEEGKFTADGSFVRTFDPHAAHDRWLEGTDEREMKKARRAKRALERKERDRLRKEQREEESLKHGGKVEIEKEMLTLMQQGETVLEALARLGEKAKKAKDKEKRLQKKHPRSESLAMDLDTNGNALRSKSTKTPSKDPPQKQQIERLTALSSQLMGLGDIDIYNKTYEHILRSVRSSGTVEPDWLPPPMQYEYKWDVPEAPQVEGQEQVFGPYGADDLRTWYDAAYFGVSGEKIKIRPVGGEWGDWDDVF